MSYDVCMFVMTLPTARLTGRLEEITMWHAKPKKFRCDCRKRRSYNPKIGSGSVTASDIARQFSSASRHGVWLEGGLMLHAVAFSTTS